MNDYAQGTSEWKHARHGLPTGSMASSLVKSDGSPSDQMKGYALQLAADRFAGKALDSFKGNSATERGNIMEPQARAYYSFERNTDVTECGFIVDTLERYGASPDGLVGDDGLVEIKCQLAKGHVETALKIQRTGKVPTTYIAQMMFQMLVTGRQWCDLVLYHPDLPSQIMRVDKDLEFEKKLLQQINACILERDAALEKLIQLSEAA